MKQVRLDQLNEGDAFWTDFGYKIQGQEMLCHEFKVVKFRSNNVKCITDWSVSDFPYPIYFSKNKLVFVNDVTILNTDEDVAFKTLWSSLPHCIDLSSEDIWRQVFHAGVEYGKTLNNEETLRE